MQNRTEQPFMKAKANKVTKGAPALTVVIATKGRCLRGQCKYRRKNLEWSSAERDKGVLGKDF